MRVFFVSGSPKSGTTWLQRVLDAHPQVACSGEGHFMDEFSIPLAALMKRYNARLREMATNVYEGRPCYPEVTQADHDRLVRTFMLERMSARATEPGVVWVGDKTPRYSIRLEALARLFPQARFINIVRDPRDVLASTLTHRARVGRCDEEAPDKRTAALRAAVNVWKLDVESSRQFAATNPGRLHNLRYEDMVDDPAGEARKLFEFLEVAIGDDVLAEVVRATAFETQSGRPRGQEDPNAFLRKGIVGDWVGRLEAPMLEYLEQTCGDLMRSYGYRSA